MPNLTPPRPVPPARMRWRFIGLTLVLLVFIGAALFVRSRLAGPPPQQFETVPCTRGPLQAKVTATGTVNPIVTVQVGSQVSGTISGARRRLQHASSRRAR